MTRRSWMVRSSTFASDTFTSPATTRPLSRILSRMSTSPCGCRCNPRSLIVKVRPPLDGRETLPHLFDRPNRAEREVQILIGEPKDALHLVHLFFELHQRGTQPLDLFLAEITAVHASQRLFLEKAPHQLDDRQNQFRQPVLDDLGIGRDPLRDRRLREGHALAKFLFVVGDDHGLRHDSAKTSNGQGAERRNGTSGTLRLSVWPASASRVREARSMSPASSTDVASRLIQRWRTARGTIVASTFSLNDGGTATASRASCSARM